MADVSHTFTFALSRGGMTESTHVVEVTAAAERSCNVTVNAATTDKQVEFPLYLVGLKAIFLVSTQDVTVEVNDGTAPDKTITLAAGVPAFWYVGGGADAEDFLGADVTDLYITNAGGAAASVKIRALVDADAPPFERTYSSAGTFVLSGLDGYPSVSASCVAAGGGGGWGHNSGASLGCGGSGGGKVRGLIPQALFTSGGTIRIDVPAGGAGGDSGSPAGGGLDGGDAVVRISVSPLTILVSASGGHGGYPAVPGLSAGGAFGAAHPNVTVLEITAGQDGNYGAILAGDGAGGDGATGASGGAGGATGGDGATPGGGGGGAIGGAGGAGGAGRVVIRYPPL